MLTIYLLIISFAAAEPCFDKIYQPHRGLESGMYVCPAEKATVAFYFSDKKAIKERDMLVIKGDAARMFRLDFDFNRFWGMHMEQIKEEAPKAFSVKEISTVPVQSYETTETEVKVTGD